VDRDQLHKLLTFGIQRGVSDIHFAVGHRPHYRVKGDLLAAKYAPMTPEDTVDISRILLSDQAWEPATGLKQERDISYSIPGVGRFRVHIFGQRGSVGIVIRVIPYEVRSFDALNLPRVLADIGGSRRGLILVTGATGMGKSTTIAAIIKHINETRHAHVVTIEDPIEFLFGHGKSIITQREVGSDTASYRDALVAALRQDPDVIMVGEVTVQGGVPPPSPK
jgi:twitching motility protein PilT